MHKKIYEGTKEFLMTISGLILITSFLIFVTYTSLSWNGRIDSISTYKSFVGQVAFYSFILYLVIIIFLKLLTDKNDFLKSFDKVLDFFGSALGIILAGILGSIYFKWLWVDFFGALLVWGFFIWFYLVITYRLIKTGSLTKN